MNGCWCIAESLINNLMNMETVLTISSVQIAMILNMGHGGYESFRKTGILRGPNQFPYSTDPYSGANNSNGYAHIHSVKVFIQDHY